MNDDPTLPKLNNPMLSNNPVYSVSRLNQESRLLLESHYKTVFVEGEISNLSKPASGHLYFSLKDNKAQVRCALFKNRLLGLECVPENGLQIIVQARVSLYEGRGDYQLIVDNAFDVGLGRLQRAYELLKKKLMAEGLFDEAHKKLPPLYPTKVGVITSATGAAIRDILSTLKQRFPWSGVILYPCEVQGAHSAPSIIQALKTADYRQECDVLILSRGGGSLEDLWGFNDEALARCIAGSNIPIITGIGHEIDFTIADFVADIRCPTPTAAATHAVPSQREVQNQLKQQQFQLQKNLLSLIHQQQLQVQHLSKRLPHPMTIIAQKIQALDYLLSRANQAMQRQWQIPKTRCLELHHRLLQLHPSLAISHQSYQLMTLRQRLLIVMRERIESQKQSLFTKMATLDAVSPLATLRRGYAIVSDKNQTIIKDSRQVSIGDAMDIQLHHGRIQCLVSATTRSQE